LLDTVLSNYISDGYGGNLMRISTLSQVAQIMTNLEHFEIACSELERSLTALQCELYPFLSHVNTQEKKKVL